MVWSQPRLVINMCRRRDLSRPDHVINDLAECTGERRLCLQPAGQLRRPTRCRRPPGPPPPLRCSLCADRPPSLPLAHAREPPRPLCYFIKKQTLENTTKTRSDMLQVERLKIRPTPGNATGILIRKYVHL